VAVQLAVITNNELSNEEVGAGPVLGGTSCDEERPLHLLFFSSSSSSPLHHLLIIFISSSSSPLLHLQVSKVVTKVKQLVNVATINSSLASTVVLIMSNVMSSGAATAATSERYPHSTGLYWPLLASSGLYWHLLASSGLYWHLLSSSDL